MRRIKVEVARWVLDAFRREAKRMFPKEAAAILIGQSFGDLYVIDDIWIPEDIESHVTEDCVYWQRHWDVDAYYQAEDEGEIVLGRIHSHPFRFVQCGGEFAGCAEPAPSEGDWQYGWDGVYGICVVAEQEDGSLRTRTRFFGPAIAAETKVA